LCHSLVRSVIVGSKGRRQGVFTFNDSCFAIAVYSLERTRVRRKKSRIIQIGKVKGSRIQKYIFEDIAPLNGVNYYRIKQAEIDGHNIYSGTLAVGFNTMNVVKLYPNPVKDILMLQGLNINSSTKLSIVNLAGAVLAQTTVAGSSYSWNIKQLPSGNYYLRIEENKKITTLKFIKE
jgi:hypothetical protein